MLDQLSGSVCRKRTMLVVLARASATARADTKDDVRAAIGQLNAVQSYSWTVREAGGGADVSGKLQNGDYTSLIAPLDGKLTPMVIQGYKQAVPTDAGWKTAEELVEDPNQTALLTEMTRYVKSPAEQMQDDADRVPSFTDDGDTVFVGALSANAAAKLLKPSRHSMTFHNAQGTFTLTTSNGTVSQTVLHLTGTLSGSGPDQPIDRTITTTIHDINHTTPDVPAAAKAELGK